MKNIKTVSAICGAGKSYALCNYINAQEDKNNHLIVLPSLVLINQVNTDLIKSDFGIVDKITSKTAKDTVKSDINKFFNSCLDSGHALTISWQGYDDLPYFQNKSNWEVYIDELPQVDKIHTVDISKNPQLLTDFIELKHNINSDIASVSIKEGCTHKLQQAHDSTDDGYKEFKPLYRALLSVNRDVFVLIDDWNIVINRYKTEHKTGELTFLAMLNPKQFRDATLLAANIEQSLLYRWFSGFHQVNFTPHELLTRKLRYTHHNQDTGNRTEIYYCLDDRKYSKYCRDMVMDNGLTIGQELDDIAIKFFDDEDFLYVTNNDYTPSIIDSSNRAHKLPVKSHGLNAYQDFNAIYFNLAVNLTPKHLALFKALGITDDEIRIANTYETIYQCIMRTSLRNPDSNSVVRIIVPDESTALYLSDLLGGASVMPKLAGISLPSKLPNFTASERNNRSRCFSSQTRLIGTDNNNPALNSSLLPAINSGTDRTQKLLHLCSIKEESNQMCKLIDMTKSQVAVTIQNHRYNQLENEFSDYIFDTVDFISLLAQFGRTTVTNKDEVVMLNSAVFDGSIDTDGYRRQANFIQSNMMILDFDDGELSAEQFEDIFWYRTNKVQRRSFIICNSYSRSKEQPNRFRVFMFYKHAVTSIEQHKAVLKDITNTLEKNGFDSTNSGLDSTCKSGIQSFYMPCINRSQPDYAFFRKHGLKRIADIDKYGIDTKTIIKTQPTVTEEKYSDSWSYDIPNIEREQSIANIIQSMKLRTKDRHNAFFDAAIKFRGLGLSLSEIENRCYEIAGNEEMMRKKVSSIMASLRKYQR